MIIKNQTKDELIYKLYQTFDRFSNQCPQQQSSQKSSYDHSTLFSACVITIPLTLRIRRYCATSENMSVMQHAAAMLVGSTSALNTMSSGSLDFMTRSVSQTPGKIPDRIPA